MLEVKNNEVLTMSKTKRLSKNEAIFDKVQNPPKVTHEYLLVRDKTRCFIRKCLSEKYKIDSYRLSAESVQRLDEITQDFIRELVSLAPMKDRSGHTAKTLFPENVEKGLELWHIKFVLDRFSSQAEDLKKSAERLVHFTTMLGFELHGDQKEVKEDGSDTTEAIGESREAGIESKGSG